MLTKIFTNADLSILESDMNTFMDNEYYQFYQLTSICQNTAGDYVTVLLYRDNTPPPIE